MSQQHSNTRIAIPIPSLGIMLEDSTATVTANAAPRRSSQTTPGSNTLATLAYHSNRQYSPQSTHTHTTPTRGQNEHHPPPWRSQDQSQRFGNRSDRRLNSFSPLPTPPLSHWPVASADQQQQQQQQNRQQSFHLSSPPSALQDQLERLVAEASSVVGGFTSTTPLRLESPLHYEATSSSAGSPNYNYQALHSDPESESFSSATPSTSPTTTTPTTTTMSSPPAPQILPTTSNPSRAVPRTSSIDSAISSVSAVSSHAHSSSTSNNAFSHITGNTPADIQALIQAAGSAEELIRYMLKEKQSVTTQNSQLWRLVDKQRAMILGLNKDLERAMKEKDRYRKKLKEHMGMIPPLPSNASVETATPDKSRALSESPAPSLDETQSRSESTSPPPRPRGSGVSRTDSLASSIDRGREGHTSSALDVTIAPYPSTPSPTHPQPTISHAHERMPSPVELAHQPTGTASADHGNSWGANLSEGSPTMEFREVALPDVLHDDEDNIVESTPISPKTAVPVLHSTGVREKFESVPQVQVQSEPLNQARKLGISTAVAPAVGLGKSPFRKAPPAPLELPQFQLQNQVEQDVCGKETEGTGASGQSNVSWENTPEDKKGLSVPMPRFLNNGPLTAPPMRSLPAPYMQSVPLTPNPSNLEMARRLSPDANSARINPQFVRAPLPSPGLPSSPRPIDRPAGSPMPRGSRNFSLDSSLGGLPKPMFQSMVPGTPRSSAPLGSQRFPFANGHERCGSNGSSGSSNLKPLDLMIQPSAIATVDSRVVSSRLRPARASMIPGRAKTVEDSVFTLGVFSRANGKEILRVEKDVGALPAVDAKLRKYISYDAKVPDRALFTGYSPARVDARRVAIDDYFAGVLSAAIPDERAALVLCEFFSTDVAENSPNSAVKVQEEGAGAADKSMGSNVIKEGYLTKRGKNFGGWKERYFVLDAPVLKYFDSPGGAQLGQIKLHNAQIGRQSSKSKDESSADEDNQYRHAFLVLEPKRKDSTTLVRHVLCAENDKERDEWVNALLDYVTTDKEEESKRKPKHSRSKESNEETKESKETKGGNDEGRDADVSSLRSMSYDEVTQGPAPARGPTPEELSRHQVSPSPTSMLSQPQSQQFSSTSPVPDRSYPPKQISAPSNGTVISDLAAWGALKLGAQHEDKKAEKAAKKRSIWGFRQRSSSDLDDQLKPGPQSGYQQAVERFPLSKPVFGASLEEAVYLTKPPGIDVTLPSVVYRCIEYLDAKNASEEEGIFRLSGSNVVIRGLKEKFNTECDINLLAHDEYYDVHAISGLLKLYLRELPTSILTSARRDDFVEVTEMEDKNQKVSALNDLVHSLPPENFALLKALSGHLLRIVDNSNVNKMTIRNVGIVFSPTLNIPAQVFSMFLHEYRYIFFRDGDAPSLSPKPPMSPRQQQTFDSPARSLSAPRMMQPPLSPMLPSHPAAIRPPGSAPQMVSYEPNYDHQPHITSPTQISAPRFDVDLNASSSSSSAGGGGLTVPGDGKSNKSRRRESSMMFMMGGLKKSSAFQPSKSNAMVEDDLYG